MKCRRPNAADRVAPERRVDVALDKALAVELSKRASTLGIGLGDYVRRACIRLEKDVAAGVAKPLDEQVATPRAHTVVHLSLPAPYSGYPVSYLRAVIAWVVTLDLPPPIPFATVRNERGQIEAVEAPDTRQPVNS